MKRLVLIVLLMICCLAPVGQSVGQQPTLTYPFPGMEWSPDGSSIAFTSREGAWLYSDGNIYEITLGAIDDITWSPNGDLVALLSRSRSQAMFTGEIEIWDVSSFVSPILVRSFTDDGMKGEDVENLDWSPVANLIAVSGIGIRIWNADNGALVTTTQSDALFSEVQWSPDGLEVASFSSTLTIWNGLTGQLQQEIELPLSIYWGSWGNDSQYIAIVQSSGGVPYYGIDIYELGLTQPNLSPIILAYDYPLARTEWKGNTLVSLTSGGIQLWDVLTHEPIRKISLMGRYNFALSPDGSQIAYIQDGVLQIQTVNMPFIAPTPTPTPTNPDLIRTVQSLVSDETCVLPCWWGFTLHRDTLQTIKNTLDDLFPNLLVQSIVEDKSTETFIVPPTGPDLDSENGNGVVSFWTRNLDNRLVAVNLSLDYPSDSYVDWSAYMPANILTVYGEPEDVTISYPLDGLPRGTSYYLSLSYPQKGIFISYMMYYITLEESVDDSVGIPLCNYLSDVGLFKMWIQTEDANADDIGIPLDALDSLYPNEYHLEDISTYDMETFTEAFSEPDTCIYTLPYDEWVRSE